MSRLRLVSGLAKAACAVALVVGGVVACDDDGKGLPVRCQEPLPLDDIANAGFPAVTNPCLTAIGHSVSYVGSSGGATTAGTSSGGSGNGSTAGTSGSQGGADAGAGGADAGAGGA